MQILKIALAQSDRRGLAAARRRFTEFEEKSDRNMADTSLIHPLFGMARNMNRLAFEIGASRHRRVLRCTILTSIQLPIH